MVKKDTKKDSVVVFRCSKEEKDRLFWLAERKKMSVSELLLDVFERAYERYLDKN